MPVTTQELLLVQLHGSAAASLTLRRCYECCILLDCTITSAERKWTHHPFLFTRWWSLLQVKRICFSMRAEGPTAQTCCWRSHSRQPGMARLCLRHWQVRVNAGSTCIASERQLRCTLARRFVPPAPTIAYGHHLHSRLQWQPPCQAASNAVGPALPPIMYTTQTMACHDLAESMQQRVAVHFLSFLCPLQG